MTKNKQLQELIKKKREITEQIRMLRSENTSVGSVRVAQEEYWTMSQGKWKLDIKVNYHDGRKKNVIWKSVILDENRSEVIKAIPQLIKDLQALYDLEGESNNSTPDGNDDSLGDWFPEDCEIFTEDE